VPTLLVHAQDDPLTSYEAAERAAKRIPGARLVLVPSGGHLLIGQHDVVGPAISAFLAEQLPTPEPGAGYDHDGNDV
jgi:pimeloyl-ACP methyl ester carboxylesterase